MRLSTAESVCKHQDFAESPYKSAYCTSQEGNLRRWREWSQSPYFLSWSCCFCAWVATEWLPSLVLFIGAWSGGSGWPPLHSNARLLAYLPHIWSYHHSAQCKTTPLIISPFPENHWRRHRHNFLTASPGTTWSQHHRCRAMLFSFFLFLKD